MHERDKELAALAALDEVRPGMVVGLGTGSTAAHVIRHLGERVRGGLAVTAVATSHASEAMARAAGITLRDFADLSDVDLAIDGADEIDDGLRCIKGAGGAMLREKIVATAARRMVVVADGSKRVAALGRAPVPVEVLPFALAFARARLEALGARVTLRMAVATPYRTDQGNPVLDCAFPALPDPAAIAAIPGVLGHGLFLTEVDAAWIATDGTVTRLERQG
ncbi:ribose-5-phosphate isomerase RpiA [Sphingomonas sp.]|uniref:ribose-5-phosphate isomerase RpiA n=1 Tax=Sphingomonas sp. TaxID=28214 RepID=UPI002C5940E8|nr:ribose-5-phosphate isomerase RpiA [Sphingomonas sp.]HWK36030.1 ribose-5-phosphate isomerase RpiA [Sphingomonas sp.]